MDETAEQHENQAMVVVDRAMGLTITSEAGYQEAGATLVAIKDAAKRIAAFWEEPVKKANAAWKALTERRAAMLKPLEGAEKHLKASMAAYHVKMEQERAKKEAAIRAELEAKQKAEAEELAKENEMLGNKAEAEQIRQAPVVAPAVTLPAVKVPERVSFREDWKAEVIDVALIPREFLLVDEAKLAKLARAMKADANVPGVRFYAEKVVVAGR